MYYASPIPSKTLVCLLVDFQMGVVSSKVYRLYSHPKPPASVQYGMTGVNKDLSPGLTKFYRAMPLYLLPPPEQIPESALRFLNERKRRQMGLLTFRRSSLLVLDASQFQTCMRVLLDVLTFRRACILLDACCCIYRVI